MTKKQAHTIIYSQDFQPSLGVFQINGHTKQHRAEFYDYDSDSEKTIENFNTVIKTITEITEQDIPTFINSLETIVANLKTLSNQVKNPNNVIINGKHGHGLEAGVKATLKKEFKKEFKK